MKEFERKLAAKLLDMASDTYSNHGCNDFELPNTQENVDLLNRMEQWNVGPDGTPEEVHEYDPTDETLYTADWYLMSYLADQLASCGGMGEI